MFSAGVLNGGFPCKQAIKEIADSGAKVVVTGSTLGDMALHFCNKYSM